MLRTTAQSHDLVSVTRAIVQPRERSNHCSPLWPQHSDPIPSYPMHPNHTTQPCCPRSLRNHFPLRLR